MENQTETFNTGKGVLFALGAAIVIAALWAVLIRLIDGGTGGAIGGGIAALVGVVSATAYRFGKVELIGLDASFSRAFWLDIGVTGAISAIAGASMVKGTTLKKKRPNTTNATTSIIT